MNDEDEKDARVDATIELLIKEHMRNIRRRILAPKHHSRHATDCCTASTGCSDRSKTTLNTVVDTVLHDEIITAHKTSNRGRRTNTRLPSLPFSLRMPFDPKLRTHAAQKIVYDVRTSHIGSPPIGYGFGHLTASRDLNPIPRPKKQVSSLVRDDYLSQNSHVSSVMISSTQKYTPLQWGNTESSSFSHVHAFPSKVNVQEPTFVTDRWSSSRDSVKDQLQNACGFGASQRATSTGRLHFVPPSHSPGPKYIPTFSQTNRRPSSATRLGPKSDRSAKRI